MKEVHAVSQVDKSLTLARLWRWGTRETVGSPSEAELIFNAYSSMWRGETAGKRSSNLMNLLALICSKTLAGSAGKPEECGDVLCCGGMAEASNGHKDCGKLRLDKSSSRTADVAAAPLCKTDGEIIGPEAESIKSVGWKLETGTGTAGTEPGTETGTGTCG